MRQAVEFYSPDDIVRPGEIPVGPTANTPEDVGLVPSSETELDNQGEDLNEEASLEDVVSNIAERYVKTSQKTPDYSYEPVRMSEVLFARTVVEEAKPVGKPDKDGFYEHYEIDGDKVIDGGDIEIFKKMIRRKGMERPQNDPASAKINEPDNSPSMNAGNDKQRKADRRRPINPRSGGDTETKSATEAAPDASSAAGTVKSGKQKKSAAEKGNQTSGEAAGSEPKADSAAKPEYVGGSRQRRAAREEAKVARENEKTSSQEQRSSGTESSKDKPELAADADNVNDRRNDDSDDALPTTAGYLRLKLGGDKNNVDDWIYREPVEVPAPKATKVSEPTAEAVPEATSQAVPDQADEPVINILFPATDGSGEFVDGFRFQPRARAKTEAASSQTEETSSEAGDQTDDSESPTVVDGKVVDADDADDSAESQPLSRAERMRIAVKKIGAAILAADSLKMNEGDKRKEINLDDLGHRIKESLKRASDRAAAGALVVKATAQNTLESASDKLRAKDEDGERGKYSPLKIAVAGAGVLATAGVAYMAYRGISAGGVGNAAYSGANKGGYNPYAGGSIGRGGISAESAVPQGSGRLVNHPNVSDIVPEAASGAPKFNDEQLSNYATLHAGQRVDTAGEALQDMFRKNGVAANREQFNTLLQDALKYDADVHQFTEGKTYDPTSMPDGYRFYLMNMDDIMRRLDELK